MEVGEEIIHAHAGHALATASTSADLVVLGGLGHPGHEGPGGLVTQAVLNHAHCPVSIVPAQEPPGIPYRAESAEGIASRPPDWPMAKGAADWAASMASATGVPATR